MLPDQSFQNRPAYFITTALLFSSLINALWDHLDAIGMFDVWQRDGHKIPLPVTLVMGVGVLSVTFLFSAQLARLILALLDRFKGL